MAVLTIASLLSFFENENKSISRGENHFKSSHEESFRASQGVLKGQVHASMKKKGLKNGLVGEDHVLEAKCSYTFRDVSIEEALKSDTFCLEKEKMDRTH